MTPDLIKMLEDMNAHTMIEILRRRLVHRVGLRGNQVTVTHEVVTTTTTKLLTSFVAMEPQPRIMIQDHANVDNNQNLCLNQNDINFLEFNVSIRNQEKKRAAESEVKVADVKIDRSSKVGDGRTHRLPHNKYGPCTCPRCMSVFSTSQKFAAHMSSHYKYETGDKKRTRLFAKHKNMFFQLFLEPAAGGLTILPSSLKVPLNRNRGRKKSDEKDEKQGDGQCIISPEAPGNFLVNVTDKMQGDGQYIINPEAPSNSLVDCFDMKQGDEECVISPEAPSNYLANLMIKEEPIFI
ncbi:hypothetical protein GH714_011977 [Hevea brasiliensis]|uniref:C2H2-type domain-containing protein n=1 Tax=Hevea brasiliensis TaxID=3981 RepID=A0A6A6KFD5_HEVBR|nr:hypothetical protein GH714_011977 [Hevea brasiliensis]